MRNGTNLETPLASKFEYFIVILLIFLSGNPPFADRYYFAIAGILSILYLTVKSANINLKGLWAYCAFYLLLSLCQLFILGSVSYFGVINFVLKIIFGVVVLRILGVRFRYTYLNILYFFSCISLVLFGLQLIGLSLPVLWYNGAKTNSIFIYSWVTEPETIPRNYGLFWEPGAYSAYLILIALLYFKNLGDLFKDSRFRKKIIVLLLALISTTSTTGFIILSIIVVYYYATKTNHFLKAVCLYLPIAIIPIYFAFTQLDFMGDKLLAQFETDNEIKGDYSSSRYGAMLFDQHYIEKHPFVGNGLSEKTRFADHSFLWGESTGMGNGLTGFLANWGFIALLYYLSLVYKSLPFKKKDRWIFIFILLLQFNGEYLLNYPLYLAIPFLSHKHSI